MQGVRTTSNAIVVARGGNFFTSHGIVVKGLESSNKCFASDEEKPCKLNPLADPTGTLQRLMEAIHFPH